MGKIKLLDEKVINLIAAGEVVERPASVVKELLENSIDAGATNIVVKATNGGLENITIIDNGSGMDEEDALLALTQHATSKISDASDLENINSLGFRGEALASISAVAEIELESKTEGTKAVKLRSNNKDRVLLTSTKTTPGTNISISKLFANIPARQKFMRSTSTEWGHLQDMFISLALINLGAHLELYHNDKLIYRLPATTKFSERVFDIWGERVAEQLYEVQVEQNGMQLTAYLGSPDIARKDRKLQYIYVNNRHVTDRSLGKAIMETYRGFIHKDLQPVYFAMLHLPTSQVDVNVHPRKQEVRFSNLQQIYHFVFTSLRSTLEKSTKGALLSRIGDSTAIINEGHNERVPEQDDTDSVSQVPQFLSPNRSNSGGYTLNDNRRAYSANPNITQSLNFTKELLGSAQASSSETSAGKASVSAMPAATATSPFSGNFSNQYLQVFGTYIIYQQDDNVIFVDQHAAAEKVLYEKLMLNVNQQGNPLLVPEIIELDAEDKRQVIGKIDELAKIGLQVADFGGNSIQVTAKPAVTPNLNSEKFLQELTAHTRASGAEDETLLTVIPNPALHLTIATMACHGAIRAGQILTQPEMRQLISDLAACAFPYNCPHGRPVSWVLSRYELGKNFKRTI